jgi:hypothetical protein
MNWTLRLASTSRQENYGRNITARKAANSSFPDPELFADFASESLSGEWNV